MHRAAASEMKQGQAFAQRTPRRGVAMPDPAVEPTVVIWR